MNHNKALIRPSTRQAGLRNKRLLPQGPVRKRSGFLSPPAPRGADGPGQSFDGSIPNTFRPAVAGLFFFRRTESDDGGRTTEDRLGKQDDGEPNSSSITCVLSSVV